MIENNAQLDPLTKGTCGRLSHLDRDYPLWIRSKGSLPLDQQQFGHWIRVVQFNPSRKAMVVVEEYDRRQPLEDVGAVPPPRMHTVNIKMLVVESSRQMVILEKVPLSSVARDGFGSGMSPSQVMDGLVSLPIVDQSLDVAVSLDVEISLDLKVQNPLPPNFEEVLVDIDKEIEGSIQLGSGDGSMVLNPSVLVGSESITQPNVKEN